MRAEVVEKLGLVLNNFVANHIIFREVFAFKKPYALLVEHTTLEKVESELVGASTDRALHSAECHVELSA